MKSYKNYYKIFFYVLIFFSFVSFVLFFFFRSEFSGYTHPTTTLTIFPLSSSTMPSATAVLPPPHPHLFNYLPLIPQDDKPILFIILFLAMIFLFLFVLLEVTLSRASNPYNQCMHTFFKFYLEVTLSLRN